MGSQAMTDVLTTDDVRKAAAELENSSVSANPDGQYYVFLDMDLWQRQLRSKTILASVMLVLSALYSGFLVVVGLQQIKPSALQQLVFSVLVFSDVVYLYFTYHACREAWHLRIWIRDMWQVLPKPPAAVDESTIDYESER
jgi:hypothetical protein